jgi:catechol 2,3-dioxygenase-like lactoylglutathione lyase family enzyme
MHAVPSSVMALASDDPEFDGANSQEDLELGRAGLHHVGLATYKLEETLAFYTGKLGWKVVMNDFLSPPAGGQMRHVFIDTGDGSYFAFLSPENVPGIPNTWASDIASGLKVPSGFYHFALWVDDEKALRAKRQFLLDRNVDVSPVMDHDFCKSIYFFDPNGIKLEYCATVREWKPEDLEMRTTKISTIEGDPAEAARWMKKMAMSHESN